MDIFVPTSEDNLGHFHPDGANLKMQTHFVPTMMCQKSCPNFLAAVLWRNLFCSIGPSGLNWVENNFPIFYYLHTHHTYLHTHPPIMDSSNTIVYIQTLFSFPSNSAHFCLLLLEI